MASGSFAATVAKAQEKKKKVKEGQRSLGTKMKNIWDSGSKTDNGIKEM